MKPRPLTLRPHEARRLAEHGDVLCVRAVKDQPAPSPAYAYCTRFYHDSEYSRERGATFEGWPFIANRWWFADASGPRSGHLCPFGRVGDVLWGRETWAANAFLNLRKPRELVGEEIYYRATYPNDSHFMWRPSSTMPRELSRFPRLVPEKVEVRRITAVTEDEAIGAGVLEATEVLYNGSLTCSDARLGMQNVVSEYHGPDAWFDDAWCWFATLKASDAC